MKAYQNFARAVDEADGRPIVKVGTTYLVGDFDTLTEVALIRGDHTYAAHVTLGHLDRLGNANHAKAAETTHRYPAFARTVDKIREEVPKAEVSEPKKWGNRG